MATNFRSASPQEIARCIRGQVVETLTLGESVNRRSPKELLSLIDCARRAAKANADWLDAQDDLLGLLKAIEPHLPTQAQMLDEASLNEGRASEFATLGVRVREAIAVRRA